MSTRFFLERLVAALLIGGAAAWLAPAAASVIRCVGPDGRISYQDKSCPNGAPGIPVDATPNRGFEFATRQQIEKASRPPPEEAQLPRPRAARARVVHKPPNAGERRFIRTGMHSAEVRRRFGKPDEIAQPVSAGAKRTERNASRQWIYMPADDAPQTTTTLTVRNGLVLHVDRKVTH